MLPQIPKKLSRLLLLLGFTAATAAAQTTTLVQYGPNGKLQYTPNSRGDVIPDFSGVGYMNGEAEIPNVPVVRTISAISGDNRQRIQDLIDEVEALPLSQRGAILFTAGTYNINGTLTVNASGIVLRGAGPGSDGFGTGGTRFIATSTAGNENNKTALIRFSGGSISEDGASERNVIGNPVSGQSYTYVPLGTKQFTVQSGHSFQVGDWVYLVHTPNQAWVNLLGMNTLNNPWSPGSYDYRMERKVVGVSGNLITLDSPNMDPIDSRYATASIVKISSTRIEQCGIENIYFESVYNPSVEYLNEDDIVYKSDENHTWKAVEFGPIKNAWARNLHARYFAYACVYIESSSASFITVDNCKMYTPIALAEGGRRYAFANEGQRNLVMNCWAERGRHDFASGSNTAGPNVYYNCVGDDPVLNTDFGPHHRWTAGALYDRVYTDMDINVQNRRNSGGGHGWAGAQIMIWNSKSRKTILQSPPAPFESWAIGHIGQVTKDGQYSTSERLGVVESQGTHIAAIPSLYLAQLNDRLGGVPAATPQFTPAPGAYTTAQSVTITTATPNTTIRYTTDGSTPSVTSGTVYSGSIALATNTTLKAIAYGGGGDPSAVATGTYDFLIGGTTVAVADGFVNRPLPSTQTGTFTLLFDAIPSTTDASIGLCLGNQTSYTGLAVILRFNTAGVIDARNGGAYAAANSIAYTSGTRYSFRLVVNVTNRTYSAYVTPSGSTEQTIGINYAFRTEQAGVTSLNTMNIDANNGSLVVGPAVIPGVQAATPTFTPDGGTHTDSVVVTIGSATSGASIRYTLDGSTPTATAGTLYTGPITITSSATLRAVAYGTGYTTSAVKSSSYTILQTAVAPTFTPPAGFYTATTNVTLAMSSPGASIRYTIDGSNPTATTGTLYTSPIAVSTSRTIKAIAYGSGYVPSAISTAAYTIDAGSSTVTSDVEFFNRALPSSQSGTFTVQFSATPSTTDATIGLCLGNQTAYSGLATIVRFNTAGRIDARNGSAYAAANVITYTSGTTYHFRLAVDVPTRTYSIFVTPAGGSEQVVGLNYAFRTEQAGVTSLNTMNIDANSGSIVVSTATITNVVPASTWDFAGPQTFNGTTDFVAGTTSSGSGTSLTVAFWATPSQLANMGAIDKLPLTGTAGWSVKLRSNGDLWFRIGSEAAGSRTDVIATAAYSANTPVHIACTYSGGTGRIYVNGVLRTTTTGITQTVNNTSTTLRLGIPSLAATGNIYAGVLENVKIFHQELTATQIQSLIVGP